MKKLITLTLATISLCSFATDEITIQGNTEISRQNPLVCKSVYILNPGGTFGVSENVEISILNSANYNRKYGTLQKVDSVPIGASFTSLDGTSFASDVGKYTLVADRVGFIADCHYMTEDYDIISTNINLIAYHPIDSNDVAEYFGSGTFNVHTNTHTYYIKSYTDPNDWHMHLIVTNSYNLSWNRNHTFDIGESPFSITQSLEHRMFYPVQADGSINTDISTAGFTFPCQTNLVAALFKKVHSNTEHTLFSWNVGTTDFSITNDVNFVIPSNSRIKAETTDDSTVVGIIYQ